MMRLPMFDRFPLRFLAPNALTALSMSFALLAIVRAHEHQFESSAWLVLWCVLLDKADGFVARRLNACSAFGVQFDSLTDLLAFCVAPGLLVYLSLTGSPDYAPLFEGAARRGYLQIGVASYVVLGGVRLARFNVTLEQVGPNWFRGLPTTLAGALIATSLLTARQFALRPSFMLAVPALVLCCALLMVSNLWLPKVVAVGRRRWALMPFAAGVAIVYGLGAARRAPWLLLLVCVGYLAIGFTTGLVRPPGSGPASTK
jgi:CDP-diacylglycerol--serine O-phosphatidyltransferase